MNPRRQAVIHQQHRTRHLASSADAYSFFILLTSSVLFKRVESLLPDHRERLFPTTQTLSMFMAQAMIAVRPCQRAVNEVAIKQLQVAHEAVAGVPEGAIGGLPLTRILNRLTLHRGLPKAIRTDNGKEFCGKTMPTHFNSDESEAPCGI